MKNPRFVFYRSTDGWRWRLVAGNGRVVASGEAHSRRCDAVRAAKGVARLAKVAELLLRIDGAA